jgi:V8-like Glu-specific endopeptidase
MCNDKDRPKDFAGAYRRKLTGFGEGSLESTGDSPAANLSDAGIDDRTAAVKQQLYTIIDQYLDKSPELYAIADKIVTKGGDALKAVANDDNRYLERNPESRGLLEVIVRTDGSRPSFMIRNGKIDRATSPLGNWSSVLDSAEDQLNTAIAAVGRINDDGDHVGTGFLVQDNLIITNRHVMQDIATKENDGQWHMKANVSIDFGYEYRARKSIAPRKLKGVVFCGSKYIDRHKIDHAKLDLALLELEPANGGETIKKMPIYTGPEWSEGRNIIYAIGYPGNPGLDGLVVYKTLLEQLFKSTFGYKRLAPGELMKSSNGLAAMSVAHDTTTLGGNSGSAILAQSKEYAIAGLHYGGTLKEPRENWCHVFANTLDATDGRSSKTFKEHLEEQGVAMIDE